MQVFCCLFIYVYVLQLQVFFHLFIYVYVLQLQVFFSFVYICIAVVDPIIKRGGM